MQGPCGACAGHFGGLAGSYVHPSQRHHHGECPSPLPASAFHHPLLFSNCDQKQPERRSRMFMRTVLLLLLLIIIIIIIIIIIMTTAT
eukprot:3689844-Rhodomonas_salina.3